MLPDWALTDEQTQSQLGDRALDEVLACLWPGDCQTCGDGLSDSPPALVVDDLDFLTRASLHHPGCRAPEWNGSFLVRTSGTALLTWRTVVLLLPFQDGGREICVAGLLVNPGLEGVWLARDSGAWHPRLDEAFASAGLSHPSAGIPVQRPSPGLTGSMTPLSLSASVEGWLETYESDAEPEICAAAHQLGGFLLIVTHAVDPLELTRDQLMLAFTSPATLVGWAQA